LIHDLIKPRKFNCVSTVSRGISSALPWWAAEFTKFAAEFVKFWRGKLWALLMMWMSMITQINPTSIWQTLFTSILHPHALWFFHQSRFH